MKKIYFNLMQFIITAVLSIVLILPVTGQDRKLISEIDSDQLTRETQPSFSEADDHMVLAWWIPLEFWKAAFLRDQSLSDTDRNEIINLLSEVSILGVVQADISSFGSFRFYSQKQVENSLKVFYSNSENKTNRLHPLKKIDPDLELLIEFIKPMLSAAMGNMGNNFHFFVFSDITQFGQRVIDPYQAGSLSIHLQERQTNDITGTIELPLNSLFIPRQCPNGKDAHVSWIYCPWTGQQLD